VRSPTPPCRGLVLPVSAGPSATTWPRAGDAASGRSQYAAPAAHRPVAASLQAGERALTWSHGSGTGQDGPGQNNYTEFNPEKTRSGACPR
jgi:hypothetical protein